ncbi:MAG: PPC domain-containing protein, partial [Chloroflexota bacterium]
MFRRLALRRAGLAILVLTLAAGLISSPVFAQDSVRRQLVVGDVVTGTLNSETFVQMYSISASAGDTITIDVTTEVSDLAPVVIVTDQRGSVVASDVDLSSPTTASIADINIPNTGTYYIAVMRGSGAEGEAGGQFTLRLSGLQQVGGQMVTLTGGGLLFELSWNAAVNLNL